MRVASIVRTTLGLKDHRVVRVTGSSEFTVELEVIRGRWLPCGGCGTRSRVRDRLKARGWDHVPLWNIPVTLVYRPVRVSCPQCGVRVERIPWGMGKSPLSEPLVLVLALWSRRLAWDVVADLFGVSWSTVAGAVRRAVDFGLSHREVGTVLHLGVDEISRRKGHIYHTQVYDLDEKRLLYSGDGREAASLRRFFEERGPEWCSRIRAVCCDMWRPYVDVIREMCPNAVLVFDKFHLVRHVLHAVDQVRRAETKNLGRHKDNVLRGSRYIWLKNPHNLTEAQEQRLSFLERLNLKTNRAYLLKEIFGNLWICRTKRQAAQFLKWWFWRATHSRLEPMRKLAWMIRRHEDGILTWFDEQIDNGATEAMNNNAKAVAHRSRGFRTPHIYTLAQLHCLGKLPLPETVHRFA